MNLGRTKHEFISQKVFYGILEKQYIIIHTKIDFNKIGTTPRVTIVQSEFILWI